MCWGGLTLLPEGLRARRAAPEGPASASVLPNWSQLVWTCLDLSQLVATCRNLSELVWSPVALRAGPGVPIPKDFQAWYHQTASFMPAGPIPSGRKDGGTVRQIWHARPLKGSADTFLGQPSMGFRISGLPEIRLSGFPRILISEFRAGEKARKPIMTTVDGNN